MPKKQPKPASRRVIEAAPVASKMDPAYWLERLFNGVYTYQGRRFKARTWSVKIQHLGRRRTFSLPSNQRRQAAVEACQLYRTIIGSGWENASTRNGRRGLPSSLPANDQTPGPDRFERDFWGRKLIHREYTMDLDPRASGEFSVQIEHQGTVHYFPLGTADRELAAKRALRIYRAVTTHGWKFAGERFRRELAVAFRWLDHPLAWTYTTIHTQTGIPRNFAPPPARRGDGLLRTVIAEPDAGIREALVWCINHTEGFCNEAAFASAEEALRQLPRRNASLLIVNYTLTDKPGVACLEELKKAAPGAAGLLYSVYEDSEELFRTTPGGAGTYLLRRTPPNRFLDPIAQVLAQPKSTNEDVTAAVWQYFKNTVASLPVGDTARQLPQLTEREREVLALLSKGQLDKEIAVRLAISIYTVHEHVRNIFEKLHVRNRIEAVVKFLQK